MKLEVNGVPYENFVSASVELRLDALSNTFSFEAVDTGELPFKGGESCKVLVDDEVVLTGFIEIVQGSYSARSHRILIQGRDKTGDLLDSTIGIISDIRAPISLKSIIEKVILNLVDNDESKVNIFVIDNAEPELFNKAEDLIAPEHGDNAFEFIEKLARKRQVLLSSNKDGDIVITQSSAEFINGRIQNILGSDTNNVVTASFSYDTTGRYNIYKLVSALNPSTLNFAGLTDLAEVVNQSGGVPDSNIRLGRQLILVSEAASSNAQNKDRATWEANIRKARGRVYSAVINGYRDLDDNLWEINKLVPIIDSFAGITANMLINSIAFTFDDQNGRQTTMSFVDENAYTLILEEPKTEKIGAGLFQI